MKLIEALKKTKDLMRKADDLEEKIGKHCAISSVETAEYGQNQRKKVTEWLQGHGDIIKEILHLRVAIQRTNIETEVTIELGDKQVTKTIAQWIHRRRDLAGAQKDVWLKLTDRGVSEGITKGPSGDEVKITVVRFFDPEERDKMVAQYAEEPSLIDAQLEITNAVTDLIE